MSLHICEINPRGNGQYGEWVLLANDGPAAVRLLGLELTDYTRTQQHVHVLQLPDVTLPRRAVAYVFTQVGTNSWVRPGRELHLYANRRAPVWNNTGDVAYLRLSDGRFVDSFTVGDPTRHPNGH